MFNYIKYITIGVLCFLVGGTIGWLINWGTTRVQLAEAESARDKAVLEKTTMQQQWQVAVNELNETKVLLNDTLSALELIKQYSAIDKSTKEDLDKIDKTLVDEKPTEETYNEFRKMIEKFNQLQGKVATSSTSASSEQINITPFIELKNDALNLFKEATNILVEFKDKK